MLQNHLKKKNTSEANSLASDMLYCVTKVYVKPAKQLCMGVGMKSITGSYLVCKILHWFGESISCREEQRQTPEPLS